MMSLIWEKWSEFDEQKTVRKKHEQKVQPVIQNHEEKSKTSLRLLSEKSTCL
jgi:hypothetical protein